MYQFFTTFCKKKHCSYVEHAVPFQALLTTTTAAKKKKKKKKLNLYLFIYFFSVFLSLDISGESSAADDILSFSYFSDKQVDISCEMSAQQMLHMKCQEK